MAHHTNVEFVPLNIAVLTVSDTRTLETDTSGQVLQERLEAEGHADQAEGKVQKTVGDVKEDIKH